MGIMARRRLSPHSLLRWNPVARTPRTHVPRTGTAQTAAPRTHATQKCTLVYIHATQTHRTRATRTGALCVLWQTERRLRTALQFLRSLFNRFSLLCSCLAVLNEVYGMCVVYLLHLVPLCHVFLAAKWASPKPPVNPNDVQFMSMFGGNPDPTVMDLGGVGCRAVRVGLWGAGGGGGGGCGWRADVGGAGL